jgi:hypothetical protein
MKVNGHIIINGHDTAETAKCCHCAYVFEIKRGSGTDRGFCMKCFEPTCGKQECDPCYPFLKKLDDYEKKMRRLV